MAEELAPELLDAVRLAARGVRTAELVPESENPAALCLSCNNPASRMDGRCAACATIIRETKDIVADGQARMARRALEYADLQFDAAKRAAAKGDATPAQWALLHTRVVAPVEAKSTGGHQVIVQVGMILPGLPGAE